MILELGKIFEKSLQIARLNPGVPNAWTDDGGYAKSLRIVLQKALIEGRSLKEMRRILSFFSPLVDILMLDDEVIDTFIGIETETSFGQACVAMRFDFHP